MHCTVVALALVVALWSCVSAQSPDGMGDVLRTRLDALSKLAWLDAEWVMAFRVTAGVRQSAYDTFMDNDRDDDRPLARAFMPPGCLTASGQCDRHYRSSLLNDWPSAYIDQVRVSLFKDGHEVAYVLFNGTNSTEGSWFCKDKVLNSTWTDLSGSEPFNFFSVPGHNDDKRSLWSRRFYINRNYGGCAADSGWLSVQDQTWDVCSWGRVRSPAVYPAILYSKEENYVNFKSGHVGKADTMVIAVKFLADK